MNTLKKTAMMLALGVGGLAAATGVSADNLIDLTDSSSIACTGSQPCVLNTPALIDGATVSSSSGQLKFYTPYGGPTSGTDLWGASNTQAGFDGAGVTDDEVNGGNQDNVSIVFASAVTVTRIEALDLFTSNDGTENMLVQFYDSGDSLITDTTLVGTDPLNASTMGGYVSASLNVANVKSIVFTMVTSGCVNAAGASVGCKDDGSADGAVAGVTTVPIPAAAWLFGSALVGMIGVGHRKSRKA